MAPPINATLLTGVNAIPLTFIFKNEFLRGSLLLIAALHLSVLAVLAWHIAHATPTQEKLHGVSSKEQGDPTSGDFNSEPLLKDPEPQYLLPPFPVLLS